MSEVVLEARELHKSYPSGEGTLHVLRGLDLTVRAGEALAVVGDSGVGKSTLLHLLGALDRPDRGSIRFRGRELVGAGIGWLSAFRNRHVGFVFQFHHLLPEFTALENVEMPFRIGRRNGTSRDRARALLTVLGMQDRLHHHPSALSGGEQQRVAVARAVVTQPDLVLADEPTGNLDPSTGQVVFEQLRALQQERGCALIVATHSARLASRCDRVLRLDAGVLRAMGSSERDAFFPG